MIAPSSLATDVAAPDTPPRAPGDAFARCGSLRQGTGWDTLFAFVPPSGFDIVLQRVVSTETSREGFLGACPTSMATGSTTMREFVEYFRAPAYDLQAVVFCCDTDRDHETAGYVRFVRSQDLMQKYGIGPLPPIPAGENAVNLTDYYMKQNKLQELSILRGLTNCPDIFWNQTIRLHHCLDPGMSVRGQAFDFYGMTAW